MKIRLIPQPIPQPGPRGGATLSEVLVSLLVMSIGIVFLISMFPASVLKTAKANQLTVATGLRYNAEAYLHLFPTILLDPDANGQADNFYGTNSFLLDPLSYSVGQTGMAGGLPSFCGLTPRFDGGLVSNPQLAENVGGLADTWDNRFESNRVSNQTSFGIRVDDFTTSGVEDPSVSLLSWLGSLPTANPPPPPMRVILFDVNGIGSQTRRLTKINTATGDLTWTEDLNGNSSLDAGDADENLNGALDTHPLPSGFTVGKVRIESATRKFTWMMTVRPQSIGLNSERQFDIDCVVFHGRTFASNEESVYGTAPTGFMGVIDNLVASTTLNIIQGQRTVFVSWGTGTKPNLLRGGFLFDAQNGYWYQITNYSDPSGGSSVVTIAEAARANSTLGVFFRTVVDVFPLEPQSVTLE